MQLPFGSAAMVTRLAAPLEIMVQSYFSRVGAAAVGLKTPAVAFLFCTCGEWRCSFLLAAFLYYRCDEAIRLSLSPSIYR